MSPAKVLVLSALFAVALAQDPSYDGGDGGTKVVFQGKSPNFQIYPNKTLPNYIQLRFAKLTELDASGTFVNGHVVTSFASADMNWNESRITVQNTTYTQVTLLLFPLTKNSFTTSCTGNGGGGSTNGNGNGNGNGHRRMLLATLDLVKADVLPAVQAVEDVDVPKVLVGRSLKQTNPATDPWVKISVLFGMNDTVSFPYGNGSSISVPRGGLKFNVEYANWPFCGPNNTLSVDINMNIQGGEAASINQTSNADGSKVLSVPMTNTTAANITFADYGYESANGTRKMPVSVAFKNKDASNAGQTTVTLRMPNPSPNNTFYYDPTVILATYGGDNGAASGVRTTVWAVLGALLLSVYTSGTGRL